MNVTGGLWTNWEELPLFALLVAYVVQLQLISFVHIFGSSFTPGLSDLRFLPCNSSWDGRKLLEHQLILLLLDTISSDCVAVFELDVISY
jgi:hypothetical protein